MLVQLRQLGDILLTTPCIREIKKKIPNAHVTFLSHKMGGLVLDGCPYLDEFYTYHENDGLWSGCKLAKTLRHRHFDTVIDFMNNPRSGLYAFATGAAERVSFRSKRRIFYTEVVPRSSADRYIVQEKFDLLQAVGVKGEDESLLLPWFEHHTGPAFRFFAENDLETGPRVVLSPTHRREPRRWPLERYAALADHLCHHWRAHVTWLWGPGEQEVVRQCQKMAKEPTHVAPETSFREMAALIANHDLFVGNSNGPSHVAVAVKTPSLQIHGPTKGASWCPDNTTHRFLQASDARVESVFLDQVKQRLEELRPRVEKAVNERRDQGPRFSWRR